jgi:hypothetical protein
MSRSKLVPALLIILSPACGSDVGGNEGGASAVAERDSAGVHIVESQAPSWADGEGWTVDPEPTLQIGTLSGDPDYQLFQVRSVITLGDGSIVVANGDQTLRFFDASGRFIRSVGREGDGPGEFRTLRSIQRLAGDTVFAWDSRLRRATFISGDGEILPSPPLPRGVPVGQLSRGSDGSYLSTGTNRAVPASRRSDGHAQALAQGMYRVRGTDPVSIDTLFNFHSNERYVAKPEPAPTSEAVPAAPVLGLVQFTLGQRSIGLPLALSGFVKSAQGRIYSSSNATARVEEYSEEGTLLRSIRIPGLEVPIDEARADSLRQELMDWVESDEEREAVITRLDDVGLPPVMPVHGGIHIGTGGEIWLAPYLMPGYEIIESGPRHWNVVDAEGRWLGKVDFPERFTPMEFGADYVLGVWLDEFDVEYVQRLQISR